MNKLAIRCIPLYVITLFFYGILIKLTFNIPILFSFKTIFPELLLTIIILGGFINIIKRQLRVNNKLMLILTIYILFVILINLSQKPTVEQILMLLRDLVLPIIVFFSIYQLDISKELQRDMIYKITNISIIFVITGSILAMAQTILGWEWTSRFYTGYEFYGLDEYSKVKIWHAGNMLRVPSLTGSSVSFAFYNLISYLFIVFSNIKPSMKRSILLLAVINIYLSTSKTALIIVILIIILDLIRANKKNSRRIVTIALFSTTIIIIGIIIVKYPNLMSSFNHRIILWGDIFSNLSIFDIIIPLNLFNMTASSSGFMSILDNSYIYFLYSIGLIGFLLMVTKTINLIKTSKKNEYKLFINYFILILIISSTVINITQGRGFFNLFCLLIPIIEKNVLDSE